MPLRFHVTPALPRADLNLTPMIDVMLVLLMIFMIVVPALATMVDLPVAVNAVHDPEEPEDVTLTIAFSGRYLLEPRADPVYGPMFINVAQLRVELAALYGDRTRDRILYLKADSTLPFGEVEQAMWIARRSGVRVVAAVSERRVQPGM